MPSYAHIILALAVVAPVLATSLDSGISANQLERRTLENPNARPQAHMATGTETNAPGNTHKHHSQLAKKIRHLEREVEALNRIVFNMEHFFASFSHTMSVSGHKHGHHFHHHHHHHGHYHHHNHKKPSNATEPPAAADSDTKTLTSHRLSAVHSSASDASGVSPIAPRSFDEDEDLNERDDEVEARDLDDFDMEGRGDDDSMFEERAEFESLEALD